MPAKASTMNLNNAIQAYVAGESAEDACKRFHIGYGRLVMELQERGLFRTATQRNALKSIKGSIARIPLPIEDITQRYLAGESELALAQAYGVSRNVITQRLSGAGIEHRGAGTAQSLRAAKMTPEQRSENTHAAHNAARGRPQSLEEKTRRAYTRQRKQLGTSPAELLLKEWLMSHGIVTIPQMAVGPYNVDLGTDTVAVEIFGGGWHAYGSHIARFPERCRYLLDRGFNLIIIWIGDGRRMPAMTSAVADYVASFIQVASGDPSMRGEYRVIWGDGKEVPVSSLNIDNLSLIPSRRAANNAGA